MIGILAQTGEQLTVTVGLTLIGAFIGWSVGIVQKRSEIQKLKQEIVTLQGTHLSNVQKYRREYSDAAAECGRRVSVLVQLMRSDAAIHEVDAAREALCCSLLEQTIPAYLSHVEWQQLDRKSDVELIKNLIEDDVIPELERFAKWLTVINDPRLRAPLRRNPACVQLRNMTPFRKMVRDIPHVEKTKYFAKIDAAIEKVVRAGDVPKETAAAG